MPITSILYDQGLHLRQNVIYRARMLIKAPGIVATEGKVREALEAEGFRDIRFIDKDGLPPDWPGTERDDPSGAFSWTAYLEGRFSLTDRVIPLSELPGTVDVLGMWADLAAPAAPPPVAQVQPPPAPSGPPVDVAAAFRAYAQQGGISTGSKVVAVAIGLGLGWVFWRRFL